MADSAERVLKILLQLRADAAGAQQIKSELKAVEAQAAQTTAALAKSSRPTFETIDLRNASVEERARVMALINGAETKSIANTLQQNLLESRRLVMVTELEAAEARIAGNPAMAVKLEREAVIRAEALSIQRTMNITQEESLILAERMLLAQEAQGASFLFAGASLSKAKAEAITLSRELATGSFNARTLGAFLGSMGAGITISSLVAYELYQLLTASANESLRLAQETRKQTDELVKQVTEWNNLAEAAGDFGDVLKFGEKLEQDLAKAAEKLEEFRNKEIGVWKFLGDIIASQWSAIPGYGPKPFQEGQDKQTETQVKALRSLAVEAQAFRERAEEAANVWESIQLKPLNEAIEKQSALVDQARVKYKELQTETHKLAAGKLDEDGTEKLIRLQKELDAAGRKVELQTKRLDELTKTNTKLATETDKAAAALKKVELGELTNPQKLEAFATQIDGIQAKLLELGVSADSPNDALEKSKTLTAEIREEVVKLITTWAAVLGEINKTNDAQADDTRRAAQKQHNEALREQAALERRIREAQSDVKGNPFLSIADRNARLIPLLQQEAAAHRQAGNAAKAHAAEMEALALTFEGSLQASMVAWVNNFGSAADQTAGVITGTLNAAIQQTAQLLTDAIFRTGDWEKAILSVGETFVQQLITMGIQMVIQHTLGEALKTSATTSSVVHAGVVTAAAVPAAVAESGATGGFNWTAAGIAAAAAIALIVGLMAAGGGFAGGGRTGPRRRFATVGEEGEEFVFTHRATENIGVENLYAMMHAAERAPRFGEGGRIEPNYLPGNRGRVYTGYNPDYMGPRNWAGGGPTVDLGGGVRPILRWPYPGPNQGGYIVGIDRIDILAYDPEDYPLVETPTSTGGTRPPRWSMDDEPVLFGDPHAGGSGGQPLVQVGPWGLTGSAPFWNQPQRFGYMPYQSWWNLPGTAPYAYDRVGSGIIEYAGVRSITPGIGGSDIDYSDPGFAAAEARGAAETAALRAAGVLPPVGGAGSGLSIGTHWDFTQGRYVANNNATGAQFNSRAAGALEMWFQSMGGNPNTMTVGDAGRDVFRSGHGRLDPESGMISVVQAGNIAGQHSVWRDPRWVEPSQAESARLGLSFDARKFNAWLIEHNPWFYNAIPGGADGLRIPGPASRADNILAWLSTGERVVAADVNIANEQRYGFDWDKKFPVELPRFATGGRVNSSAAVSSGRGRQSKMKLVLVADMKAAIREREREPDFITTIINAVNSSRHEIGLPAVE